MSSALRAIGVNFVGGLTIMDCGGALSHSCSNGGASVSSKDLLELAQRLNQERQFIASERLHLQQLNEKVQKTVERLFHATWIARQQRLNLDSLILSKGYSDSTPSACCQRASLLEGVRFVDAYKQLGFHESQYGEFLQSLRDNPRMLAMCLAAGEARLGSADPTLHHVVHVVVDSVYGHCVLQEDEQLVLQLLRHLMEMQLASNDNPLRLLRHGTCAFGRVYKLFNEGLFSAKLFLTGALHDPIMHLLMEDELFLDIDPSKAVVRFPPHERRRRFGEEGTPQYAASLQRYRNWTINKLVHLTERFVVGIRDNMYCFPGSLLWLIRQLYNALMRAKRVEVREVGAICADLVFAAFVCPAIVNPEPYGVCDAPIGYIARFNLMQVAQILQVLAMSKWEEIDPKLMDLYGRFEKDCMSSLLDQLLEGGVDDMPKIGITPMQGLVRTAVLITGTNLQSLVYFLRVIVNDSTEKWVDKQVLQSVLNLLPSSSSSSSVSSTPGYPKTTAESCGGVNGSSPILSQSPGPRKSILGKVARNRHRGAIASAVAGSVTCGGDHHPYHHHQHHANGGGRHSPSLQHGHLLQESGGCGDDSNNSPSTNLVEIEDVLVISLNVNMECPGMLPEHKVLSIEQQQQQQKQVRLKLDVEEDVVVDDDDDDDDDDEEDRSSVGEGAGVPRAGETHGEKRTRFSLSHDQDSIGNASDNLEAVSEAASNHSVSSSIELENENDNLSDMISANVSGRGTPNVSGRGTPSSQVEGDERDRRPLDLPVTAEKQNREDISDKFGKFEIKTLMSGDETVSIISDTWSTDVLASDSETVEQGERQMEYAHHIGGISSSTAVVSFTGAVLNGQQQRQQHQLSIVASVAAAAMLDTTETASEAWSTDVAASDSERLQDVDTDDTASVTRSDDTASIARSDDATASATTADPLRCDVTDHGDENVTPRASGGRSPIDGLNGAWINVPLTVDLQSSTVKSVEQDAAMAPISQQLVELSKVFDDLDVRGKDSSKRSPDNKIDPFDSLREIIRSDKTNLGDLEISEIRERSFSLLSDDAASAVSDVMGMQSLGRLSFAMDDLQPPPQNNGVNGDGPSDVDVFCQTENGDLMAETWSEDADDDGRCDERSFLTTSKQVENGNGNVGIKTTTMTTSNSHLSNVSGTRQLSYSSLTSISSGSSGDRVGRISGDVSMNVSIDASPPPWTLMKQTKVMVRGGGPLETPPIPTASSGAIPKSISFDKTAERGDKEATMDGGGEDSKGKKSFFRNFKLTLKRPVRKGITSTIASSSDDYKEKSNGSNRVMQETGEDILAKYRNKPQLTDEDVTLDCDRPTDGQPGIPIIDDDDVDNRRTYRGSTSRSHVHEGRDEEAVTTIINNDDQLEDTYAFNDAKRKLRLVLSTAAETQAGMAGDSGRFGGDRHRGNELAGFLKIQLAEAINLQDRSLTAQLHEALRCVGVFDKAGCRKLLKSLTEDYKKRHLYVAYLIRCRQSLLSSLSHSERLLRRVERDKEVCNICMISVCVRLFLERHERRIQGFLEDFQKLTASDEKTDMVEEFLQGLYKQAENELMWQDASSGQLDRAQSAIERSIMSKIYILSLYPNGDGDVHRDQVLHEHIKKLSKVITPNHKDLRIPKIYHYECPWPSAQAEVITINAYKTPGDKLQCVVRCCTTIMNLLRMANDKSVPAADDFIPVLVYVVIKANPASLLSTVQYVNSFFQKQLRGEDEYWWTQFSSAVEFIKTMDYTE